MIRKIGSFDRIPWKTLTEGMTREPSPVWHQESICKDSKAGQWVIDIIRSNRKHFVADNKTDIIFHDFTSVPDHRDHMDESCILLVLRCGVNVRFTQAYQSVPVKKGDVLTFNDHIIHGIDNPDMSRIMMISCSKGYSPR